ncbi:glycoside hydrolase family 35 protein [Coprinellus micaceus]|uniref:beta-galactosidase n=1 Tax=Coprinellus micaceus TaxID=71717 RepID=A0A4Y7SEW2_COPMI|nr:glycoside hydrolase family 35 protein [Coprinellus micaceus]
MLHQAQLFALLAFLFIGLAQGRAGSGAHLKASFTGSHLQRRYSDDVRYDNYTLFIKGRRVFLHSGEFHTFRLPVPSLWPDIFQKAKAAGLNSLSVYLHMGLTNPAPGVVDFGSYRAVKPLYEAAMETGIWIVIRPGPYINAETTAGGMSHWATSEVAGRLRTNATDWKAAWKDYIKGFIEETEPYHIANGGPVIAVQIDNEYNHNPPEQAGYFQDLVDFYRNSTLDALLTYNDVGSKSFINGTGAVDLVGLDAYPQGFDCSNPLRWRPVVMTMRQFHLDANPWQPWYIPEFQGGAFDAWGPDAPGYDSCRILTGPEFESVFYLHLWATNAKLINYYMFYGGTSWGGIPYPGVYTSYDYGASASITESRELTTKYDELKRQGLFIRSSPEFYKTEWIGDSSTGLLTSSNPDVYVTTLKNADTPASFYIVRHRDSTLNSTVTFQLDVTTEVGVVRLPRFVDSFTLSGRQSKVIVTDYSFGKSSSILYSTTQVYFAGVIDGRDVILLYGDLDLDHETSFAVDAPSIHPPQSSSRVTVKEAVNRAGKSISEAQLVLLADTATATTFWSPTISGAEADPFRNFWGIGTNESILVGGPYLVRDAMIKGHSLALRGDLNEDVSLTVIAPRNVESLSWNGKVLSPDLRASSELSAFDGVFVFDLKSRARKAELEIPELGGWKYKDSLPEVQLAYDDTHWVVANHTTTNIPYKPYYGDGRVLYGCDYGFCENIVLWRGHFEATGAEKSVNLSINGGNAFAGSVWLNDVFIGTSFGNSTNNRNNREETDDKFAFPEGALFLNQDNVITVIHDNMGLNESHSGSDPKSPRGIRGFKLDTGLFGEWKVQGKVGGYHDFPDRTRGVLNEGGLFGERVGWHLPGFTLDDTWVERDLASGLPEQAAGVGFFVTKFALNIPQGLDAMFSFEFEEDLGQLYRAYLFVNGWMMGKRVANLGPQAKFPVHEGILDYHGENTIAVALWAMTPKVRIAPSLKLKLNSVYEGGAGNVVVDNPGWSAEGRLEA